MLRKVFWMHEGMVADDDVATASRWREDVLLWKAS